MANLVVFAYAMGKTMGWGFFTLPLATAMNCTKWFYTRRFWAQLLLLFRPPDSPSTAANCPPLPLRRGKGLFQSLALPADEAGSLQPGSISCHRAAMPWITFVTCLLPKPPHRRGKPSRKLRGVCWCFFFNKVFLSADGKFSHSARSASKAGRQRCLRRQPGLRLVPSARPQAVTSAPQEPTPLYKFRGAGRRRA